LVAAAALLVEASAARRLAAARVMAATARAWMGRVIFIGINIVRAYLYISL